MHWGQFYHKKKFMKLKLVNASLVNLIAASFVKILVENMCQFTICAMSSLDVPFSVSKFPFVFVTKFKFPRLIRYSFYKC